MGVDWKEKNVEISQNAENSKGISEHYVPVDNNSMLKYWEIKNFLKRCEIMLNERENFTVISYATVKDGGSWF